MHYEYAVASGPLPRWPVPEENRGNGDWCPYCGRTDELVTRDHIFAELLGGSRWIKAGELCNKRFGHTIEASVNREIITPHYVLLSAFGLKHIREGATWKRAFTRDGRDYHLIGRSGTLQERLAKPIIIRNAEGDVVGGDFPDYRMGKPLIEHARESGRRVTVLPNTDFPKAIPSLVCSLNFGPVLLRPALKICMAAAALLGIEPARLRDAWADVHGDPASPIQRCAVVSIDYADIKNLGEPLSHVVYVERAPNRVYGVFQLFGVMQIYCLLSDVPGTGASVAVCGVLDPLTGKERFDFTVPLNLPINNDYRIPTEAFSDESLAQWIVSGLQEQALKRGGKDLHPRVLPPTSASRGSE